MNRFVLLSLLLSSFAVGTDDFVVGGLLPEIAADLGVTESVAGQLVTVFSVVYALGAPVMAGLTARLRRRRALLVGSAVFVVVNLATAVLPGYPAVLAARVVAALAAAAITPLCFTTAADVAEPDRRGRALSMVAVGLTLAMVAGTPLGVLVAGQFGWRASFVFVAALSTVALVGLAVALPDLPPAPHVPLSRKLAVLRRPVVLLGLASTVVAASGGLMLTTYLAPVLREAAGVTGDLLAVAYSCAGVAGALGAMLGGRATDRFGAERSLRAAILGHAAALALLAGLTALRAPWWLALASVGVWGFVGWGFNPPMQARLLALAPHAAAEVVALNSSALYLGTAVGGGLGGVLLATAGPAAVPAVGAVLQLVALALVAVPVSRTARAVAA
ncbi:MFS transporter [Streptoalloteichus hindustanus]|uniref:Predicted arabinose efflux permease, MFS family n=1 Tax=Streptoalloteichus hindustanus TaxID=2017 RepID=A0A1M5NRF1_STRHI|nr:MFS transporter [Streptoalloteichus hindustanus]SHG92184.1 Predicted arabinose efflux permease, MFS family [Streptoalloteichus hindustanus]